MIPTTVVGDKWNAASMASGRLKRRNTDVWHFEVIAVLTRLSTLHLEVRGVHTAATSQLSDSNAMSGFQQNYQNQGYQPQEPLAFFGSGPSSTANSPYYAGSRSSLEGNMGAGQYGASGSMSGARLGSMMVGEGRWWEAFGTGGYEGEPSLMEGECGSYAPSDQQSWVSTHHISYRRVWLF